MGNAKDKVLHLFTNILILFLSHIELQCKKLFQIHLRGQEIENDILIYLNYYTNGTYPDVRGKQTEMDVIRVHTSSRSAEASR